MIITIYNEAEGEVEALAKACERALRWVGGSYNADIYVNARSKGERAPCGDPKGWLEYHIVIKRKEDNTRYMTIGMIQRDIGQPMEFHS